MTSLKCDSFACQGLGEIYHSNNGNRWTKSWWFCRKCIKYHIDCCEGLIG